MQGDRLEILASSTIRMRFTKNLSEGITLRLDSQTLNEPRARAKDKGIGPTTLARMWILEHLQEIRKGEKSSS